jgi:nicotinamidase-related amidase
MKAALLLIDLQAHFLGENPESFERKILPNTRALLARAREGGLEIVHVVTRYAEDKSDWPEAFKFRDSIWCLESSAESAIIEGLGPAPGEHLVVKKRFTAFYETALDSILRASSIDTLFMCGYAADGCVRFTAMDAYNRGYSVYWLRDCMDSAWEDFGSSLAYMERLTRLKGLTNEEFYGMLSAL